MSREEHGPSDDRDEEVAGLADELEGAAQLEQGLDVQVALVVHHVHGRRVRRGQVLLAHHISPGLGKRGQEFGSSSSFLSGPSSATDGCGWLWRFPTYTAPAPGGGSFRGFCLLSHYLSPAMSENLGRVHERGNTLSALTG